MSRIVDAEPLDCLAWKDGEHGTTFDDGVLWVLEKIGELPTIERKTDEWCSDCKEYDQEKHCCPRWNRVIRETLSEQTEIIRCKDCKYRGVGNYCVYGTRLAWITKSNDFCSRAERRTDEGSD